MATSSSNLDALARNAAIASSERRNAGRVMVDSLSCSQGKVIDMSVNGMRIYRATRWRPGEIRKIGFPVLAGRTMTIAGRCHWIRRAGFFKWECGIEFLGLSEEQQQALRHVALTHAKRSWCGVAG